MERPQGDLRTLTRKGHVSLGFGPRNKEGAPLWGLYPTFKHSTWHTYQEYMSSLLFFGSSVGFMISKFVPICPCPHTGQKVKPKGIRGRSDCSSHAEMASFCFPANGSNQNSMNNSNECSTVQLCSNDSVLFYIISILNGKTKKHINKNTERNKLPVAMEAIRVTGWKSHGRCNSWGSLEDPTQDAHRGSSRWSKDMQPDHSMIVP